MIRTIPPVASDGDRGTNSITDEQWVRIRHHAEEIFTLGPYSIHGPDHWQRVEDVGLELARKSGADQTVVRLFAILHDSCRRNDGGDYHHGPRAADMLGSLVPDLFTLDSDRLALLEHAIRNHPKGRTSVEPTIGTCWDADRLDLGRVGMRPHERYMSTKAGRRRVRRLWSVAGRRKNIR